jgi:hypothetical protein
MAGQTGQGLTPQQVAALYASGQSINYIAQTLGVSPQMIQQYLAQAGYPSAGQNLYNNTPPQPYEQGGRPANVYNGTPTPPDQQGTTNTPPAPGTLPDKNPNAGTGQTPTTDYSALAAASSSAKSDLAERKREFDVTTARDIAKQNATEVDALQQRLASLSGPKDAYADYFFSHGLLPPQGYQPAPVPLTQAQIDAYGRMGVTPQQLQQMITGTGKPGADFGMLGSMGQSLQTPAGMPQPQLGQAPVTPQGPSNPTVPGGQLYGQTPPGGSNVQPSTPLTPPTTPGGVPSMAVGGTVPGPTGTPKLAVVHGGEEVTPAPDSGMGPGSNVTSQAPPMPPQGGAPQNGAMMNQPGLHPAIAALVDAVSNLLSNPDFTPFVQATQQSTQATSGGVQSMALGGVVSNGFPGMPSPTGLPAEMGANRLGQPAPPFGQPMGQPPTVPGGAGGALPGQQSAIPSANTTFLDNPIMPLANMDPYSRALYDIHGRLHPYSAQQEAEMGPQGVGAVSSYVSRVQGGDINAYKDLVDRLRPQGLTQSGDVQGEGFTTG